jgi:hypothetical protein
MEELLRTIISQNERLLSVLDRLAEKLEVLDDIEDAIGALESSIVGALPSGFGVDFERIASNLSEVVDELQWTKDLSAVAQIIKAVENVEEAVRERQ